MSAVNRKRMQFGTTVDSNLLEQFRTIADMSDIPISKLTDKAFMLLIQYYSENETVPFNGVPYGMTGFEGTSSTFTPSEIIRNKLGKVTRDTLNKRNKIAHKETIHNEKTESDIESEIMDINLDEVENALFIIKYFKNNFNNAKLAKLNEDSNDTTPNDFTNDDIEDRLDDIISNLDIPSESSPQINTSKSNK